MDTLKNPFLLSAYSGPEYFCNREVETKRIIDNALNGVNTTLMSIRRMGKTGIIYHAFHALEKKKDVRCLYVDLFSAQNIAEMTNLVTGALLEAFPEKQPIGKKFLDWLKGFRPVISFDPLSGQPQVSLDFRQAVEYEQTLNSMFSFLDNQNIQVLIALDEFQQILTFPEKNVEAILRTIIQKLKNVRMLFSGSNQHLLSEIFHSGKRPFYMSTQTIKLTEIEDADYENFIREKFKSAKYDIDHEAISYILSFTRKHTYYTQSVCNRVFANGIKKIDKSFVETTAKNILIEQEHIFFQYRNLLTATQWLLLKAIAKEDKVYQPTGKDFIRRYKLDTPSNVQRSLEALLNKEMIYQEKDENGLYYRVYDCFLSRWMEYRLRE